MVGICFGHQMLAHTLGGRVARSEKGIGFGLKSFDVTTKKVWMADALDQCALYFSHQDQVMQLPPDAELLAAVRFARLRFMRLTAVFWAFKVIPKLHLKW